MALLGFRYTFSLTLHLGNRSLVAEHSTDSRNYHEARKVTLIGAALDLVLGLLKIGVGVIGHSQALVADGVHSLSDLATDALVIWAMKYSTQDADPEHPYGHERIQTFATVVLGLGLVVVAVGLGKDAVERLIAPEVPQIPNTLTLLVAAISIASKEWIYQYTARIGRRLRSSLLEANAWHSRSDALSSIVVFAGIGGSLLGFGYLDAVATIIVAAMVFKVGGRLILEGIKELIDTGVAVKEANAMRKVMAGVEGVEGVQQFRTRMMGSTIVSDVNILVSPDISVSEGHRIAEEVERAVAPSTEQSLDITVHVDSEFAHTDESTTLPLRSALENEITAQWSAISSLPIIRVGLHYRVQQVDIDLYFAELKEIETTEFNDALMVLRQRLGAKQQFGTVQAYMEAGKEEE